MNAENATEQVELELEDKETVVEVPGTEEEGAEGTTEDQFDKADSATQKRINRLTKKMRDAERREVEAISYAKQVQEESQQIKTRMNSLDSHYVNEFSNRVNTQQQQAEETMQRAMDVGDTKAVVDAQRQLTSLAIENDRAQQAKVQQERYQQQLAAQQQAQLNQPMPQQQPQTKRPDPKAEQWAVKNDWFGEDEAMTYAAFGIHKKLVEEQGFDPQSDDYYNELDRRVSEEFPHKFKEQNRRPAQTVASASRQTTGRSGKRQVRLTPSQISIAKKLGVPLEEYAKYVKE
jgi:hypothetical protein|tara:strand:- start:17811 stop:18680 length:870 start_codon:yes stop_codon:yes gene_type:complete